MTALPIPGADPIASILAGLPQPMAIPSGGQMDTMSQPFIWGQGGERIDPNQLAERRARADYLTQGDYSPVQHWTQGLGRVLDGLEGGFERRNVRRDERALQDQRMTDIGALAGQGNADLVAGLASSDPVVQALAGKQLLARQPKAAAPHYWETNDGSLGFVGPDGTPQILYKDPTPKLNWIQADNGDGTKQLIPVGPNGPIMGGGGPASGAGGFAPPSPLGVPSGNPLQGAPNSKVIGDKQYWNIGGKWYDNPEGR